MTIGWIAELRWSKSALGYVRAKQLSGDDVIQARLDPNLHYQPEPVRLAADSPPFPALELANISAAWHTIDPMVAFANQFGPLDSSSPDLWGEQEEARTITPERLETCSKQIRKALRRLQSGDGQPIQDTLARDDHRYHVSFEWNGEALVPVVDAGSLLTFCYLQLGFLTAMPITIGECEDCGRFMLVKNARRMYCSERCKKRASRERLRD